MENKKIGEIFDYIAEKENHEFKVNEEYDQESEIFVKNENGDKVCVNSMVIKEDDIYEVIFDNNISDKYGSKHMMLLNDGNLKFVKDLKSGDIIKNTNDEKFVIKEIKDLGIKDKVYDLSVDSDTFLYSDKNGNVHHNSFGIKQVMKKAGGTEGEDWKLVKAGVSASGAYRLLYKFKDKPIIFDDADGIFKTEEGRNILKGALDSEKVRRLSWEKRGGTYNPDEVSKEDEERLLDRGQVPRYFDFTGSCIFISNLSVDKADPDGAIRSRSYVININPSDDAVIDKIKALKNTVGNENEVIAAMSENERDEVFEELFGESSDVGAPKQNEQTYDEVFGQKSDSPVSMRVYYKALALKAMGLKNWREMARAYA
jgi:hypothetical protein